jgi:phospholipid/cholesterol/gamma-HCH transport system permease protein
MAAEIGTMQVTEQVDALRSMSVNPIDYLVTPRMIAMIISVPLLITEASAFGITASWVVGTQTFGIIVLISCHQGLKAKDGAVGVGKGTTRAMVFSSLAILIINFFLTMLLNVFLPIGLAN